MAKFDAYIPIDKHDRRYFNCKFFSFFWNIDGTPWPLVDTFVGILRCCLYDINRSIQSVFIVSAGIKNY